MLTLLHRMITGGEDALYIARRLVVVASEDVGLADNHALPLVSLACEIGADGGNGGVKTKSSCRGSHLRPWRPTKPVR
jgi:hypothetical protein